MDVLLTRQKMMFGQQETELPAPEQDNLEHAATGPGTAHSERLESSEKVKRVRDRSLFTELVWQRPTVKRGAATAAAAGLGLLSGTVLNAGRKRLLGR